MPHKNLCKLNKAEASIPLDIKFGKKYHIECLLDNGFPKMTAVLKVKDEEKGREEFEAL